MTATGSHVHFYSLRGAQPYTGEPLAQSNRPRTSEERLPLEGGAPRSESKIYMTAGGSHTSTTLAQRQLRLMRL